MRRVRPAVAYLESSGSIVVLLNFTRVSKRDAFYVMVDIPRCDPQYQDTLLWQLLSAYRGLLVLDDGADAYFDNLGRTLLWTALTGSKSDG